MIYEARQAKRIHYGLAVAVLLLSTLGFAAAGIIPTESGSNPLVGWTIVAACFAAAAVFIRRAMDDSVQARIDDKGIWSRRAGSDATPWAEIDHFYAMRAGIQRIARFTRKNGTTFGINTTFYDRGITDLVAAVRHYRPDLAG
ncbi:MAG TPA: hypothetical protein VEW25_12520 [Allosphingosinicella sp.]|nr:hypothetical protein [Allosphingosinicella sp.]